MPAPTHEQIADTETRLAALRDKVRAGPTSLAEAAAVLGMPAIDLMAQLCLHELRHRPGTAALIAGADGVAVVKPAGQGEVSITVPEVLAGVLLAGLLSDPSANIAICAPIVGAASTEH